MNTKNKQDDESFNLPKDSAKKTPKESAKKNKDLDN